MNEDWLPSRWMSVRDEVGQALAEEFQREAHSSHALNGVPLKGIARRKGYDDYLFELGNGGFAVIHLTFAQEKTPSFPAFRPYANLQEWRAEAQAEADAMEDDE